MSESRVYSLKDAGSTFLIRIEPFKLRSSCVPVSEHIKDIIIMFGWKHMAGATAVVYDTNANLLFRLLVGTDSIMLDAGKLRNHSAVVRFSNNYSIYIN